MSRLPNYFSALRFFVGVLLVAQFTSPALIAQAPPATDPAIDPADYAPFNPDLIGQHPRLLFNAAELTELKTSITSQPLLDHYNRLLNYLGSSKVPTTNASAFLTNATDGQRQGLWRIPTVALHYALTGNQTSYDRTVEYMEWLLTFPHWETGGETDSGMSAGNMMIGAALAYDWLYNDLDPTLREQFRQKIFYHARAMYYLGHLGGQGGYWQGDPANNHRWHRNAGLALCMLAAYEGNPEEEWMLKQVFNELAFVAEYLPTDGTSHESPTYQVFGTAHLTLAMEASDNCFSTHYLDLPFYESVAHFRMQTVAPGFGHFFLYGDSSDASGDYNQYNMLAASHFAQPDLQDAVDHLFSVIPNSFNFGWMGVVWRGTSQLGGDYHNLRHVDHFEDLGITFMREGWNLGDAAAMFKCGPFGGVRLNDYRNANGYKYINVAHDDPDANSFILLKDDEWVAETDRYSENKRSSNFNTILVDGKGQRANGRPEGAIWSQPSTGATDMKLMAYTTWDEDNGDVVITEGEAQGSYPEISRFRRSFIWRTGQYVLALDDIRASQNRLITWLIQSGSVNTRDLAQLKFTLVKNSVNCDFQVATTKALSSTKVTSTADNKSSILGWQQLQLSTTTSNIQLASAYDLWDAGSLQVALSNVTANGATVTVTGNGINDTWEWTFAPDNNTASTIALAKAPTIREEPTGGDVGVNESATLNVARGGLGPISYQWYQGNIGDTSNPVGANSPALTTGTLSEPTMFWVRITTDYGSVDSDAFLVSLTSGFLLWVNDSVSQGSLAEDGDPDFDGLENLIEYALGLNADGPDSNRPSANKVGDWLTMNFSVPENDLVDVLYEVQVSNSLTGDWSTVLSKAGAGTWTGSAAFNLGAASNGYIPITVDVVQTSTGAKFTRLKVTRI